MRRTRQITKFAAGAVALAAVLFIADRADARGRWGSSGGSWGSSGGSWGSSGGSWGSSGGSWGSSGGSWSSHGSSGGVHVHWRGGSHGSWGSHGSSGGSWGSHGSSGGSWGSHGSSGGGHDGPADDDDDDDDDYAPPRRRSATPPPPEPSPAKKSASYGSEPEAVQLSVTVPEGARIFVNGNPTRSAGAERSFVSRNLEPGRRYKYEVRAELVRDGQPVTESKVVYVSTGDQARLVFDLGAAAVARKPAVSETRNATYNEPADEAAAPQSPARPIQAKATAEQPLQTSLRLHVPQNAKVTLSGAKTSSTGSLRVFTTSRLASGQTWANYVVRAEVERDGRPVAREVSISLKAGETRELTLDFDSPQVAAAGAVNAR